MPMFTRLCFGLALASSINQSVSQPRQIRRLKTVAFCGLGLGKRGGLIFLQAGGLLDSLAQLFEFAFDARPERA